jgi:uncharacterized membrane protein
MSPKSEVPESCAICGNTFPPDMIVAGKKVRPEVAAEIMLVHPDWSSSHCICQADLATFRKKYVHGLLESEKGELSSLNRGVVRSLEQHETLSSSPVEEPEQVWTFGERLADKVASFGGSWSFLICYGIFLFIWITMNSLVIWWQPVDPYPYIFLNLVLSSLSALQAPFIMMSQNRQEAKDRMRAQHDYQVNLKAELEIRHLHEKVDHLLTHQWQRLVKIQELQLEILADLSAHKTDSP